MTVQVVLVVSVSENGDERTGVLFIILSLGEEAVCLCWDIVIYLFNVFFFLGRERGVV